jgi:hypothetical protein
MAPEAGGRLLHPYERGTKSCETTVRESGPIRVRAINDHAGVEPCGDDVIGCQTSLLQGAHEGAQKILIEKEVSHALLDRANLIFG